MQFFDGDFQVGDTQGRNLFTLPTPASKLPTGCSEALNIECKHLFCTLSQTGYLPIHSPPISSYT